MALLEHYFLISRYVPKTNMLMNLTMVPEKLTLRTCFGCFTDIRFFINSTCIENLNPFWHDLHRTDQEKKIFFGNDHDTEKKTKCG